MTLKDGRKKGTGWEDARREWTGGGAKGRCRKVRRETGGNGKGYEIMREGKMEGKTR